MDKKEERIQYQRNYWKENKDKLNAQRRETQLGKYRVYKESAKKREIEFSLTQSEFETFWQRPCTYCGDAIETIGLDRIDSSLGYTLDNCISCCIVCNKMKLTMTKDQWFNKMKTILAFSLEI